MDIVTRKERLRRIILLIVTLVIFLAAVGFGGYAMKQRDELLPKIKAQKESNHLEVDKIAALHDEWLRFSEPIGFRSGRDVLNPEQVPTPVYAPVIRAFLNRWQARLADPYKVTRFKAWPEQLSAGDAASCLNIQQLFDEVRVLRAKFREEEKALDAVSGARGEGTGAEFKIPDGSLHKKLMEASQAAAAAAAAATDKVRVQREALNKQVEELNRRILEVKALIKTLQGTRIDSKKKLEDLLAAQLREKMRLEAEKRELQERLDRIILAREEALERQEADGRILHSDASHGVVYIDIRQNDGLFRGTKFKVFSLRKAGVKKMKGEVQVIGVLPEYTRCAVVKTLDPSDLMADGDYVFDEFYDRNRSLEFAFAGRFLGKYTNEDMERKVREFRRCRYTPKVTPDTNYVVAGEDYDKHPHYVEAIKFGIKIIREKDLYAFLGLEY